MEVGDKVTIYQDPITKQKEEGKATLVKFLSKDDDFGTEDWEVGFDNEVETYTRTIKTD